MTHEDRVELQKLLNDQNKFIASQLHEALRAFATTMNDGLIEAQQLAHKQAAEVPLERAKMHHAMECYRIRLEHALNTNDPFVVRTIEDIAKAAKLDVEILFRAIKETRDPAAL